MDQKPYHGGNLWNASRKYGIAPQSFTDFSANINPMGPSTKALEAVRENLPLIRHYPPPAAEELKETLATFLGIPAGNLLLGNGAAELIYLLGRFYDGRRIILPSPCFSEYGKGSQRSSFFYINLKPVNNFKIEYDLFLGTVCKGAVLYIGNPNNPTASLTSREELLKIYDLCRERGAVMVIDEAFIDYLDDEKEHSLRFKALHASDLLVLGSLTKFFALPGLRLGYLVATQENVEKLEKLLPTWRINILAQAAGAASLKDDGYIKETKAHNRREREFLMKGLARIDGLKPFPSAANFILVDCRDTGKTAAELEDFLGRRGILIRRCDTYKNLDSYYFRIAVRGRKDNSRLLDKIAEFFK